ncbi:uncharacterized protein C8Q71DRAFT_726939 [Rhodofomes roseus]|uniref:Uncharacterized protein n=1 Tax=Rhodofomes roseus TaxID=34475 RepID=A0ABQ8K3P5_9APHY|nr:uncharacterized protein C8Q71DRAFT_726939 [Rhodofomes roseus]KAH9831462.1 hypothetical protein C8Q71DRAFT_726939 [Rhodofomes roseus]
MSSPVASSVVASLQATPTKSSTSRKDDHIEQHRSNAIENTTTVGQDPLSSSPPQSERRSPSYAEMAAKAPFPMRSLKSVTTYSENIAPEPQPQSPTPPTNTTATVFDDSEPEGGEWKVAGKNKKKKAVSAMKFKKSKKVVVETPSRTTPATSNESRKRRRTVHDLGNDDEPTVTAIQQEPSRKAGTSNETMDIDFAIASEDDYTDLPDLLPVDDDDDDDDEEYNDNDDEHDQVTPTNAPSNTSSRSVLDGREERNGHMQFVYRGETFPFPIPPSSSPLNALPQTPPPHQRGRSSRSQHTGATQAAPVKGNLWAYDSDDALASPAPRSHKSSRLSDILMPDASPARPTSSQSRRRRPKKRANRRRLSNLARKARGASSSASASPTSSDDERIPFDAENLDPDVTVPPRSLWRKPQGDRPDWKARGMATTQKEAWDEIDETQAVVAIQIPNHGTEEPGLDERIAAMTNAFVRDLRIPNVAFIPAYSLEGFHGPNKEPHWYLARGMSLLICIALVRMGWLNSSTVTLNFDFWRDTNPLLCGMWRLIHRFGAQSKDEYLKLVRRELLSSELYCVMMHVIAKDVARGGFWEGFSPDEALNMILNSVDVDIIPARTVGNAVEPVAVLHVTPPTADRKDWLRFCDMLRKHGFGSSETGHPVAFTGRLCKRRPPSHSSSKMAGLSEAEDAAVDLAADYLVAAEVRCEEDVDTETVKGMSTLVFVHISLFAYCSVTMS